MKWLKEESPDVEQQPLAEGNFNLYIDIKYIYISLHMYRY